MATDTSADTCADTSPDTLIEPGNRSLWNKTHQYGRGRARVVLRVYPSPLFSGGSIKAPPEDAPTTLAEIGITPKQSATAQKLASIPKTEFHERIAVAKAGGE